MWSRTWWSQIFWCSLQIDICRRTKYAISVCLSVSFVVTVITQLQLPQFACAALRNCAINSQWVRTHIQRQVYLHIFSPRPISWNSVYMNSLLVSGTYWPFMLCANRCTSERTFWRQEAHRRPHAQLCLWHWVWDCVSVVRMRVIPAHRLAKSCHWHSIISGARVVCASLALISLPCAWFCHQKCVQGSGFNSELNDAAVSLSTWIAVDIQCINILPCEF